MRMLTSTMLEGISIDDLAASVDRMELSQAEVRELDKSLK